MQFSASSSVSASHTLGWDFLDPLLSCHLTNPSFPWHSSQGLAVLVLEHSCKFSYGELAGRPASWTLCWVLHSSEASSGSCFSLCPCSTALRPPLAPSSPSALASSASLLPQQPRAQALDHSYSSNLCRQGSALGLKIHFGHVQLLAVLRAWVVITSCPWVPGVVGGRTPGEPGDTALAINLEGTPVERRDVDCEKAA